MEHLGWKIAVSGSMNLVADMATNANRAIRPNTLGFYISYFLFPELFCFFLILKCGDYHILVLIGRTIKSHYAILLLFNT